jgi:hypothetical protein
VKNLLALLGLAIVLFAGLGWYLGWYHVAVTPAADGHRKVEFDVNTSKLKEDVSSGYDKSKEFIDTFRKDKPASTAPAEDAKDFVGPPKPPNLTPSPGNNTGTTGTPGPTPFK